MAEYTRFQEYNKRIREQIVSTDRQEARALLEQAKAQQTVHENFVKQLEDNGAAPEVIAKYKAQAADLEKTSVELIVSAARTKHEARPKPESPWSKLDATAQVSRQAVVEEAPAEEAAPTEVPVVAPIDSAATSTAPGIRPEEAAPEAKPDAIGYSAVEKRAQTRVNQQVQKLKELSEKSGMWFTLTQNELFQFLLDSQIKHPRRQDAVDWLDDQVTHHEGASKIEQLKKDINSFWQRCPDQLFDKDGRFEDHYQIIGVSREDSKEKITAKFKAEMRKFHPDLYADAQKVDPTLATQAEKIAKLLGDAQSVLSQLDQLRSYFNARMDAAHRVARTSTDEELAELLKEPDLSDTDKPKEKKAQDDPQASKAETQKDAQGEKLQDLLRNGSTYRVITTLLEQMVTAGFEISDVQNKGQLDEEKLTEQPAIALMMIKNAFNEATSTNGDPDKLERLIKNITPALGLQEKLRGILVEVHTGVQTLNKIDASIFDLKIGLKFFIKNKMELTSSDGKTRDPYDTLRAIEKAENSTGLDLVATFGRITSLFDLDLKVWYELSSKFNAWERMTITPPLKITQKDRYKNYTAQRKK